MADERMRVYEVVEYALEFEGCMQDCTFMYWESVYCFVVYYGSNASRNPFRRYYSGGGVFGAFCGKFEYGYVAYENLVSWRISLIAASFGKFFTEIPMTGRRYVVSSSSFKFQPSGIVLF
jgi:hypothetical protein